MMHDLTAYRTLVFDCDGVILDSNRIKTEAFRLAALPYGDAAADELVAYHVARGGISRYEKFRHFLEAIVPPGTNGPSLEQLLDSYATHVREGLLTCAVTPELEELRQHTPDTRWLIVSGGAQDELRDVFAQRELAALFDGGIFGSPDSKDTILARELASGRITGPALFLGDSRYDHVAASAAGLDFLFVSDWSEMPGWSAYMAQHGLAHVGRVRQALTR